MATQRQIEANRRNAQRSTGPRSGAGKKRARRNSYRHGLAAAASASNPERAKAIERLARSIAIDDEKFITLEDAHTIAEAEFNLAQVRRVKVAMISRIIVPRQSEMGSFIPDRTEIPMPETEPQRTAEAFRQALVKLINLDRYEKRAAGRRDGALRRTRIR